MAPHVAFGGNTNVAIMTQVWHYDIGLVLDGNSLK